MRTGKDRVQVDAEQVPVNIGDARVNPGDILRGDAIERFVSPRIRQLSRFFRVVAGWRLNTVILVFRNRALLVTRFLCTPRSQYRTQYFGLFGAHGGKRRSRDRYCQCRQTNTDSRIHFSSFVFFCPQRSRLAPAWHCTLGVASYPPKNKGPGRSDQALLYLLRT